MKKLFTACAVVVALLLIAPWGFGKLARRHVDHGIDRLVEEMPYLTIVKRDYDSGWFRSEQEVTFEVLSDLIPAAGAVLKEKSLKPPRFTIRNEILHGPVLWPYGLGAARVDTRIVWGAELNLALFKTFGDDRPLLINTQVGFLGGSTTTVSSKARTIEPDEGGRLSWDEFEFVVHFSRDGDHMSLEGGWPRMEVESANGKKFEMRGMTANGSAKRIAGEIFDTDVKFGLESVRIEDGRESIEAKDIEYVIETENRGEYLDYSFRFGTGKIDLGEIALLETHYDFSLRRLHAASLDKLIVAMKRSYSKTRPLPDADVEIAEYRRLILGLLEHDPEFVIDRINLVTKSGDGTIKGVARFGNVVEADLEEGAKPLLAKLEANIDIDIAETLIEELGGNASLVETAVTGGYAERREGRMVSKIEYRHGDLKINGKSQGIPGVGGPSPAAHSESIAEEMPPQ
jgi:uncharacterized protein YdgA (DUF945 family)